MSVTLLAGSLAAGAASGAAGGLMGGGDTTVTPTYTPQQESLVNASQALIPHYLQSLQGIDPIAIRRYINQLRGEMKRGTRQNIQDYLRQAGMRGGQFGPAMQAQLAQIYQSANPAMAQALMGARQQALGQATQGLQQWSMIQPMGRETSTEQPSMGAQIGAGALSGLSGALGSRLSPQSTRNQPQLAAAPQPIQQGQLAQGTTLGGNGQIDVSSLLRQMNKSNV